MNDRIALNQIRLVCNEADRGSLHVKSSFDATQKMEHRTDEAISFPDDHLVVIKNAREHACMIRLESVRLESGKRFIVKPSRQATRSLWSKQDSEVRTTLALVLGGGESVVIHSSAFQTGKGLGHNIGGV